MMMKSALYAGILSSILMSCHSSNKPKDPTSKDLTSVGDIIGKGWRCTLTPDAERGAAYVVQVNKDGVVSKDSEHRHLFKIDPKPYSIGSSSVRVVGSKGAFAKILRSKVTKKIGAEVKYDNKDEFVAQASYKDTEKESLDSPQKLMIRKSIIEYYSNKENIISPGSRYFLIQEAVLAGSVVYIINRSDAQILATEAGYKDIAEIGGGFSEKGENAYELKDDLTQKLPVCFLMDEIIIESGFDGERTVEIVPNAKIEGGIPVK